ncbi:phage portal protein [Chitinibacteraceae bacterium HSL-7]
MTQANWYNADRVSQPGSVVLQGWLAERRAQRMQGNAATPSLECGAGSEFYQWATGGLAAGVSVNERTAMAVGAVYACVSLIGGAVASLPLPIYKRTLDGRERVQNDLWWLLNEQPHAAWAAATAWEYALASVLLQGDSFWRIHRASPMSPVITGFEPMAPNSADVMKDRGRLCYRFTLDDGSQIVLDQDDVLHVPGPGFDGKRGMNPVRFAALRTGAGLAKAADDYSTAFFQNGARPDFVLETGEGKLTPDSVEILRRTWAERHQGVHNAHLPAVLTGGLSVKQLTMNAEDAQLIETRRFQVEDIARIFGVPPHMIGHTEKTTSWGSGVEAQAIGFIKFTLQRWLVKFEQEINRKCFRTVRHFCEFDTKGLERGDIKTRNESYRIALGRAGEPGWMTVNEVRRSENLPPIDGGNVMASAMSPDASGGGQ